MTNKRPTDEEIRTALTLGLKCINDMMPGVRHIALQDYAIINDAPLAMTKILNGLGGPTTCPQNATPKSN